MNVFRHYILTRFNLGIYADQPSGIFGRIRTDPETWMRHRSELFFRFTLPSMTAQSCQNFTWLVMLDEATPPAWKEKFESIRFPNLRFIYSGIHENSRRRIVEEMETGDYTCITTRIDNDDAFHVEAVQRLQRCYLENAARPLPWAVIFPFGCVYGIQSNRLYMAKHHFNSFPTLVESGRNQDTIWKYPHTQIPDKYPVVLIEDNPYWLMVCHDQNISNSLKPESEITDKPMPLHLLSHFNVQPPVSANNANNH